MENNDLKEKNINDIISMANEGNVDAMNELGVRYINGEDVEKDEKKAFELFYSASEKNCIKAKFNLAMCYYNGNGIEQNDAVSFNILKELAEKYNHARSYYYLGEFYFFGGPVEIDYEKSFFYYSEALKINPEYLKAKLCIAYAYYSGKGIEKNYEIAFNMFKELVEEYKFPDAYFYLGEFYYLGRVVQQSYEKAFSYFNKSVEYEKNIYASKYYLGEMYMFGKGVNTDCPKAKMYFEEILDEKYDDTYYKLALLNSGNYGIEKNEEKTKKYFEKIEFDLCIALIYYVLAIKPEEEQSLDEIVRLLNSETEMNIVKESLFQFPQNHPSKIYHDRLSYLTKEEYKNIVEKLKNKIDICREQEMFKNILMSASSDEEVVEIVKCIVEFTESKTETEDFYKKYFAPSSKKKKIKKLTINNGNYLEMELIILYAFKDVVKCNYKKSQSVLSENVKEKNKYCELSKKDIFPLIEKINFDEKVSSDDYLEGGGAGNLSIEYEDGTILNKEFGSYMPKDINELYQLIINKLNSVDSINE